MAKVNNGLTEIEEQELIITAKKLAEVNKLLNDIDSEIKTGNVSFSEKSSATAFKNILTYLEKEQNMLNSTVIKYQSKIAVTVAESRLKEDIKGGLSF